MPLSAFFYLAMDMIRSLGRLPEAPPGDWSAGMGLANGQRARPVSASGLRCEKAAVRSFDRVLGATGMALEFLFERAFPARNPIREGYRDHY